MGFLRGFHIRGFGLNFLAVNRALHQDLHSWADWFERSIQGSCLSYPHVSSVATLFDGPHPPRTYGPRVPTFDGSRHNHALSRAIGAAYLNEAWGMNYPYTAAELEDMWAAAVASGDYLSLHNLLDAANNSQVQTNAAGMTEHMYPISAGGW